jgi:hypothetical protein
MLETMSREQLSGIVGHEVIASFRASRADKRAGVPH